MRSSARCGAVAIVVVAALTGCSSTTSKTPATGQTTTTAKPTPTARPAPASFGELEARILTDAPVAFAVQPDAAYDTGPSDLAKAVKDDGSPNAGKVLRAEKFVRGYQRIWIGPGKAQIIVFVYQFESRTGARQDYSRDARGYDSKPPPGAYKFAATHLPAGQALGVAESDKGGGAALVYFTTGVFNVEINCNAPKLAGLQARASAIAEAQLNRL